MKLSKLPILTATVFLSLAASVIAQVANPSFEDPITYDGPPFVGSWEGFSGGGASSANSTVYPRTGLQSLALSIGSPGAPAVNSFAGAFQDIPGIVGGLEYSWSGYHASLSNPLNVGVEVRIEWLDSVANVEVGRTGNATPIPGAAYSLFSQTAFAPLNADTARIVYAIQSYSTSPLGDGLVYVDDISFVPEPSAMILLSLGGMALMTIRRQRA